MSEVGSQLQNPTFKHGEDKDEQTGSSMVVDSTEA
jgi:hypothetical protein